MFPLVVLALLSAFVTSASGQAPTTQGTEFPSDPRVALEAAKPFYDFFSSESKPLHLKASYQFYDEKGKPAEQGVWEHWWMSPKVYHSHWTRADAQSEEWGTADGTFYEKATGNPLRYFERNIEAIILSPLPGPAMLEPSRTKLEMKMLPPNKPELACIFLNQQLMNHGKLEPSRNPPPEYCFDMATKALLFSYKDMLTTQYTQLVKIENQYLAKRIAVMYGKQTIFSVSVDVVGGVDPADPATVPPPDATLVPSAPEAPRPGQNELMAGALVKSAPPIYPATAKAAGEQGVVVLAGKIGIDGKVHDLEVVASPSPMLSQAAIDAVKTWEYRPYLLNGKPVEIETTVDVTFTLGR